MQIDLPSRAAPTATNGTPRRKQCGWAGKPECRALAGILLLAAALRLLGLNWQNLIFDECASVLIVRMHWRDFFAVLAHREANMSLYYLLLRGWMTALRAIAPNWARQEAAIRLLSVLIGLAEFPLLFALGRRLYSARAGLLAGLLLAPNMLALRYAQDARSYSLYLLLLTAAAFQLLRALEAPAKQRRRRWAVYCVLSIAAVYAHFFAGLFLLSQWIWLALKRPPKTAWKPLWISVGSILLLVSPLIAFVLFHNRGQISWVPAPFFGQITGFLQALAGEGAHTASVLWPLWWLWLGLVIFGMTMGLRHQPEAAADAGAENSPAKLPPHARALTGLLALWLWLPIALTFLGSYLWQPMFVNRYLLPCLIPWALLAARGLEAIRPRRALPYVLALLLGMQAAADFSYYQHRIPPWRQATGYFLRHYRPGDRILAYQDGGAIVLDYYLYRDHREALAAGMIYPESADPAQLLRARGVHGRAKELALERLHRLPVGARVWMLLDLNYKAPGWALRLPQRVLYFHNQPLPRFPLMQQRIFNGIHLMLFQKVAQPLPLLRPPRPAWLRQLPARATK